MAWRNSLSDRESEVCELVSKGLSNERISKQISISPHTVKTHLRNIYSKCDIKNRTSLALKFLAK